MIYYRKQKRIARGKEGACIEIFYSVAAVKDDGFSAGVTLERGETETVWGLMEIWAQEDVNKLELGKMSEEDARVLLLALSDRLQEVKCWVEFSSLSVLENCSRLEKITVVLGGKLTSLWDMRCNAALKEVNVHSCRALKDIEGVRGSSVEKLVITSEFIAYADDTNAPIIEDISPVASMQNLRSLELFIAKKERKTEELLLLSSLQSLEYLKLTKNYFTFKQFAWLKSKLPQVKDLCCTYHYKYERWSENHCYVIIGEGMPEWLVDNSGEQVDEYIGEFNRLVSSYEGIDFPPEA